MARSLKKGPFVDQKLIKKVERKWKKESNKNLVAAFNDHTRFCGTYLWCP